MRKLSRLKCDDNGHACGLIVVSKGDRVPTLNKPNQQRQTDTYRSIRVVCVFVICGRPSDVVSLDANYYGLGGAKRVRPPLIIVSTPSSSALSCAAVV